MGIELENFFGLVGKDNVAGRGAMVARDDHAVAAMEREDGGGMDNEFGGDSALGKRLGRDASPYLKLARLPGIAL